jgi:ABC-type transport system substrate-binding protein
MSGNINFSGGVDHPLEEEWEPILFTDWVLETWPSENNSLGWNNTGGIMAATFTLRENVKFHDGSTWNATVAKWNIDRYYIISGNLTGEGNLSNLDFYWPLVDNTARYWTPGWNLSAYNDTFTGYNVGPGIDYPNVNEIGGWVNNSNPWIGGEAYAPWDRYPLIKQVEILDNGTKGYGGQIKVHWNSWNSNGQDGIYIPYVSYQAYHKNYTDRGIYGWTNGVKDPNNPTVVDHMIGTGPYKYVFSDGNGGYMVKFEDYWNKTALEADGMFDVERFEFINFPFGEGGGIAQTNALLIHTIDAASDFPGANLDTQTLINNGNINYYIGETYSNIIQITLNCINETWWAWPDYDTWRRGYYSDTESSGGIPQVLRKAMNYAFNYDNLINSLEASGIAASRAGGVVGVENLYYNASVPQPYYNLTYAREILLTTENDTSGHVYTTIGGLYGYNPDPDLYNFSKRCAERGLNVSSSDAEWQAVAKSVNPIWTVDLYWDDYQDKLKEEFQTALYNIGVALTDPLGIKNRVQAGIWNNVIREYWNQTFDGTHSIWSSSAFIMAYAISPRDGLRNFDLNYRDNENGLWRIYGHAGLNIYSPGGNFGFIYDDEINDWLDRMWMSSPTLRKLYISKISTKSQNVNYNSIWAYQDRIGWFIWDCWELTLYKDKQTGVLKDYFGGFNAQFMKWKGCPKEASLIPGYSLFITVSLISILGVIYIVKQKKKLSDSSASIVIIK